MPQPANLKHTRPAPGLKGWAAAFTVLDRVLNDHQRDALCNLVHNLGVQGAPALEHAANTAAWWAGVAHDHKSARNGLRLHEVEHIDRRVKQELWVLITGGGERPLFPHARLKQDPRHA